MAGPGTARRRAYTSTRSRRVLFLTALIHRPSAAVTWSGKNFAPRTRVVLARRSVLPTPGSTTESTIIAPWPAITAIIVPARWALRLRVWQLPRERRPPRKADLSVGRHLGHHHGDLVTDVQQVLDSIDANRWVLGEFGDMD